MTAAGLIDTNVFIHALRQDSASEDCAAFMDRLEAGVASAFVDPLVLHELTYVLPRVARFRSREDVALYLLTFLGWPGITGDKATMIDAVEKWRHSSVGFVDAFLAAKAGREERAVFTKNLRDFAGRGLRVPESLATE